MIPRNIAAAFPAQLRDRGRQYHSGGLVMLDRAGANQISATVHGTSLYDVIIHALPGVLLTHCSCPYALENGECKHLWATLLAADTAHKLAPLLEIAGEQAVLDARVPQARARPARPTGREERAGPPAPKPPRTRPPPKWKSLLTNARRQMEQFAVEPPAPEAKWTDDKRLIYVVDMQASSYAPGIVVELAAERRTATGEWETAKPFRPSVAVWMAIPSETDRQIAQMLLGAQRERPYEDRSRPSGFVVGGAAIGTTLRAICQTGRCRLRRIPDEPLTVELQWDDGPAWHLRLRVARQEQGAHVVTALLERDGEEMPLSEPTMLHSVGVLFARGLVSQFEDGGAFALVALFGEHKSLTVEEGELGSLLESLHALPRLPAVDLPPGTRVAERHEPPVPSVNILPDPNVWRENRRHLELTFRYGETHVMRESDAASVFDRESLTVHHRDLAAESAALERLRALGVREELTSAWHRSGATALIMNVTKIAGLITELLGLGWQVTMQGVPYRTAGAPRAAVKSGVDWFELDAGVPFGAFEVPLHELLEARRAGEAMITL
ncbi:MAG: SWIM zinc finger family protein, partial [Gemmatimonadaceae bacterium]